MNDIEQKALALVNKIERERGEDELTPRIMRGLIIDEALCRAIEQHEAFRQEVSDAMQRVADGQAYPSLLLPFIIPKPKPDPLVRVVNEVIYAQPHGAIDEVRMADNFRAALDAAGFEIREKNDG